MRILLAVDGSRYSADVVDAVISRPWPEAGIVRVLSAVEPEQVSSADSGQADPGAKVQQPPTNATEELVELVADSLTSHGFKWEKL